MAGQIPAGRQLTEQTLAGLRFVRNQIGGEADLAEFIEADEPGPDPGEGDVTGWRWKPVPLPVLASLPPRAQAWEITRYQAYQAQLAGHTIGEIFRRAATFLTLDRRQRWPRQLILLTQMPPMGPDKPGYSWNSSLPASGTSRPARRSRTPLDNPNLATDQMIGRCIQEPAVPPWMTAEVTATPPAVGPTRRAVATTDDGLTAGDP